MNSTRQRTAILVCVLGVACTASAQSPTEQLPTEQFRENHKKIIARLETVENKLAQLDELEQSEMKAQMQEVVTFFEQHIRPHAEQEEKVLYPVVDQKSKGERPFTATMRYEHSLVDAWIESLARELDREDPDEAEFTRIAYNLTGVLKSHFEKEENVFLPLLDETMTQEEFQNEILSKMEGH